MPTRSFFGLILLIIALIVASTPALLTPTARSVETAGMKVGLLPKPKGDAATDRDADTKGRPLRPYLATRGYERQRGGDLRDVAGESRPTAGRGRLQSGATRVVMPGDVDTALQDSPPVTSERGVLLDSTGCPVFPADADVAALMADKPTAELYRSKVADADDANACTALFRTRTAAATRAPSGTLPGDRRAAASALRDDSQRMLIETYASDMFLAMFGEDVDTGRLADDLRSQVRDGA